MSLRGWGNGLAVAGLILVVGLAVGQAPKGQTKYWIALGASLVSALLAIFLLRPRDEEKAAQELAYLHSQTTVRDIAFLFAGTQAITFPETLSQHSTALAPPGETWAAETKEKAEARARRLVAMGLMEPRGSEVETSTLGHSVVAFDKTLKIRRMTKANQT